MHSLTEYSANYSSTSRVFLQCHRDEPALNNNGVIIDFSGDNDSALFGFKQNKTGQTGSDRTTNVQITVPLKYLSDFRRTRRMPLIDCEINICLTWPAECILVDRIVSNQIPTFAITDTELYVPVVTLSAQDNAKLLQQLKTDLKRTINWKK